MSSVRISKYKSDMMECVRNDLLSRLNQKYSILTEGWMRSERRIIERHDWRRAIEDRNTRNLLILAKENMVKDVDRMLNKGL